MGFNSGFKGLNFVTEMSAIKSNNYHHICLATGLWPLSTRFIHRMRSSASRFNFQHPLVSSRSSNSCLRPLPILPISFIFPSITCFRRQFLHKMWPIQLSFLLLTVCRLFLPWLYVILDTGFSWFPFVYKQMLRWFPRFQVATTCFSCSPPVLNLVLTIFMFVLTIFMFANM